MAASNSWQALYFLAEGLHKGRCKDWKSNLEYVTAREKALSLESVGCKKNNEKKFVGDLAERFQSTEVKLETLLMLVH